MKIAKDRYGKTYMLIDDYGEAKECHFFHGYHTNEIYVSLTDLLRRERLKDKCLYVMQFENKIVKIGITDNFKQRLKLAQYTNKIKIVKWVHTDYINHHKSYELEEILINRFKDKTVKGREYFDIDFEEACEALDELQEINFFSEVIP